MTASKKSWWRVRDKDMKKMTVKAFLENSLSSITKAFDSYQKVQSNDCLFN